jgi:aminobenzoyl-glutamate transport protein
MADAAPRARASWLDALERLGNALPEPATLFVLGALAVMLVSDLAVRLDWRVEKTSVREVREAVLGPDGEPVVDPATHAPLTRAALDPATGEVRRERVTETVGARSLLSSDGLYWAVSSLVANFKDFPPLAIVLVGMLGIGLADRSGFVGALLKSVLLAVPPALLTPAVLLVGVVSSIGLDAGYVVLPPVAAALYRAVGRSPLAGLAAVFAGVAAGFSANLVVTSLDTILMGFSTAGARLVDPTYRVEATANLWFMIASTFLLTAVGWAVTARVVEPRLAAKPPEEGGPGGAREPDATRLTALERRGLRAGVAALAVALAAVLAAVWIPGGPLHGRAGATPRWVAAIVPLLFVLFLVPGLAHGIATRGLRSDRDVAKALGDTMAAMGPYVVLSFFAAQFVAWFQWSGLGEMLAIAGGRVLARAALPAPLLVLAFVGGVAAANLLIGSMSAKYALFAPVFVPMLMQVGISPELTQAAYRVGDSVTNVITPLNPYMVIILVFVQRHAPGAGLGTVVALMLPYTLAFGLAWSVLLVVWMLAGLALGPAGPLAYPPGPA